METQNSLADHHTPLIRKAWYVAALCSELDEQPMVSRTILETRVVLFRKADGSIAALKDRCPHRSLPLSAGQRQGDTIVCGYHGMVFDGSGRCVHIPSQENIPAAVATPSYPVIEKPPFAWIWMGPPEEASEELIPDSPWFSDPGYDHVAGYTWAETSYVRLHQNVLDLVHLSYLHEGVFGFNDIGAVGSKFFQDGDTVGGIIKKDNAETSITPGVFDPDHRVAMETYWYSPTPAINIGYNKFDDQDLPPGEKTASTNFVHAFTPSTKTSTHYFWVVSINHNLGSPDFLTAAKNQFITIFAQDKGACEAIEQVWAEEEDFSEISVIEDKGDILFRRVLARLAAAEQAGAAPAAGSVSRKSVVAKALTEA